jgi:hypothetical protein
MGNTFLCPHVYRFEAFSLDTCAGELSLAGTRTPLREQPLQLLLALLEHPGEQKPLSSRSDFACQTIEQ